MHTICGLSNISYGLPERKFLNRNFAVMAVAEGLDSLIVNPLDKRMMAGLLAGGGPGRERSLLHEVHPGFQSGGKLEGV